MAIVQTSGYWKDASGQLTSAEPYKTHLKRMKKRLKTAEKDTNKLLKNARNAVSKHVDRVFRENQIDADYKIKVARKELKGLRTELRRDMKWTQKVPVASNTIELSTLYTEDRVAPSSYRERYKPQSESDRPVQLNRRWQDGRKDIQRVEKQMDAEIKRIKLLREAKNAVKKAAKQDVSKLLKASDGIRPKKARLKREVKDVKRQLSAQRKAALRTRLARVRRFMRF